MKWLLILLAFATQARAATVWWAFTNWDGTVSTNASVVYPLASQPTLDGQYLVIGQPKRIVGTSGLFTNVFRQGNYGITVEGLKYQKPVMFGVPNTNTTIALSSLPLSNITVGYWNPASGITNLAGDGSSITNSSMWVDVRWYGCAGIGTSHDDAPGLQAALNSACFPGTNVGKDVLVPPGMVLLLGSTVTVPQGVTLRGMAGNNAVTQLRAFGANTLVLNGDSAEEVADLWISGVSSLHVDGTNIWPGVGISGTFSIIHRCRFDQIDIGILLSSPPDQGLIERNLFHYGTYGILSTNGYVDQTTIRENGFDYYSQDDIHIAPPLGGKGTLFENNNTSDAANAGIYLSNLTATIIGGAYERDTRYSIYATNCPCLDLYGNNYQVAGTNLVLLGGTYARVSDHFLLSSTPYYVDNTSLLINLGSWFNSTLGVPFEMSFISGSGPLWASSASGMSVSSPSTFSGGLLSTGPARFTGQVNANKLSVVDLNISGAFTLSPAPWAATNTTYPPIAWYVAEDAYKTTNYIVPNRVTGQSASDLVMRQGTLVLNLSDGLFNNQPTLGMGNDVPLLQTATVLSVTNPTELMMALSFTGNRPDYELVNGYAGDIDSVYVTTNAGISYLNTTAPYSGGMGNYGYFPVTTNKMQVINCVWNGGLGVSIYTNGTLAYTASGTLWTNWATNGWSFTFPGEHVAEIAIWTNVLSAPDRAGAVFGMQQKYGNAPTTNAFSSVDLAGVSATTTNPVAIRLWNSNNIAVYQRGTNGIDTPTIGGGGGGSYDPLGAATGATNGLGSAAWYAYTAFDSAGAALNATQGITSAMLQSKIGAGIYDASGAALNATNPLGSAAWTATSAYDASGAAMGATNGLGSASFHASTDYVATNESRAVVITNLSNVINGQIIGSNVVGSHMIWVWTNPTTNGSWTMPTNCQAIHIILVGGGGGGGAGGNTNSGTAIYGGGGGSGGSYTETWYHNPSNLGAPGTVFVVTNGSGGAGGAGRAIQGMSGNNGVAGTVSAIGTIAGPIAEASAGNFGGTGSTASGLNGPAPSGSANVLGGAGGASSISANATGGSGNILGSGGGGGGGGISATPVRYTGGAGGFERSPVFQTGGTAGSANAAGNAPAARSPYTITGAAGGGGSYANADGTATLAGGAGGYPGGGGGGSGATTGAANTGNGGKGGDGIVVIEVWCGLPLPTVN